MNKHILFIQGGGYGGYEADAALVSSLRELLGETYNIHYPQMRIEEKPDFGWCQQIGEEIHAITGELVIVGHSLGASLLLKYLSENEVKKQVSGIFLLAVPFWSGNEDWVKGLKLEEGFEKKLPEEVPLFLYHCRDDKEIPFDQFSLYKQKMPWATFREIAKGGHQFNNDLTLVAKDMKLL